MFERWRRWRYKKRFAAGTGSVPEAIWMIKHCTSAVLAGLNSTGGLGTLRIAELELEDALEMIREARIWWYEKEQTPNG